MTRDQCTKALTIAIKNTSNKFYAVCVCNIALTENLLASNLFMLNDYIIFELLKESARHFNAKKTIINCLYETI